MSDPTTEPLTAALEPPELSAQRIIARILGDSTHSAAVALEIARIQDGRAGAIVMEIDPFTACVVACHLHLALARIGAGGSDRALVERVVLSLETQIGLTTPHLAEVLFQARRRQEQRPGGAA